MERETRKTSLVMKKASWDTGFGEVKKNHKSEAKLAGFPKRLTSF